MSSGRLRHCVAAITGGGRGIGAAIAHAFAKEGAAVALCSRHLEEVAGVAQGIEAAGGRALAVRCDVTQDADVTAFAAAVTERFGPANVLVNNAGIYHAARFREARFEDFRQTMEVNYFGAVRVTKAFLEPMIEGDFGRLIFVASTAGKYGSMNQSMYNASKHAVIGLVRCLALELAKTNVRVNAICPAFVDTPILRQAAPDLARVNGVPEDQVLELLASRTPVGRLAKPEEVAELAVYLASRESDYMTGHAITLSGGLVLV